MTEKNMKKTISLTLLALAAAAHADDAAITQKLHAFGLKTVEIGDSPVPGLRSVITEQGIFYATEDGKYYLQGDLVELGDNGPIDLSNRPLLPKLEALKDEMILFPAKNEKYAITVFFDSSCHYCQLLHKDIGALNERGITVRYLAFPRSGTGSKIARQMETVFSAPENRAKLPQDGLRRLFERGNAAKAAPKPAPTKYKNTTSSATSSACRAPPPSSPRKARSSPATTNRTTC